MHRAHGQPVERQREAGIERRRPPQRLHRGLVRRQHVEPAHQHVEQPLARRLVGHAGVDAVEHRAVDLAHMRGQHLDLGGMLGAQFRQRDAGAARNLGEADVLEPLLRQQRHEGADDRVALDAAGPPPGGCWGLEDWSAMTGSWTGLNWR